MPPLEYTFLWGWVQIENTFWNNPTFTKIYFSYISLGHPKNSGEDPKLHHAQPYKRFGSLKENHIDLVRVIDLTPNYIVSGSWDASIKLWSRKNGSLLASYKSPEGPVSGIFLKESLRYLLYSARSGKVKRLDILEDNSLKLSTNFELNHGDCIIDMSVNGKYVFTGGSDGKLILWTYNELNSKHTRVI